MGRRRFDHLALEISLEAEARVPRYALWLALHEHGFDPEALSRADALAFCRGPLAGFLDGLGHALSPRRARRLTRAVGRFDPAFPTPCERMARV